MNYLLGIDIGTSGTKTVLFDCFGNELASYTGEYQMYQPRNGWAEQDPLDWWKATADGIKYVLDRCPAAKGEKIPVGLSGQMHGLVMLGADGNVLGRSIIWCDQRTGSQVDKMNEIVGREKLIKISANPAMTGFTAAKILWVQDNLPSVWEKCAHILLPKDYIRYMLTGEFATEVSDASGMQLMDVGKRKWSAELLKKFNIDKSLLGKMYESCEITGVVSGKASAVTGLKEGSPVAGGAGDNAAAAIGSGVFREGRAFNTVGTSAVIYSVSDRPRIDLQGRVHSLCASVPGKWTVMSCTQSACLSLKWLRDNICTEEVAKAAKKKIDAYELMDELAEKVPAGSDKLIFLPYLMGERSPHPDPDLRGVFFGLSAAHGRAQMIRAVMEGVAFSQKECLDVFSEMGIKTDKMILCGGGAKAKLWRQIFADVYGLPVVTLKANQGGALGAALLAGVGAGHFTTIEEACNGIVRYNEPEDPSAQAPLYKSYFEIYKKLYGSLKDEMRELAII